MCSLYVILFTASSNWVHPCLCGSLESMHFYIICASHLIIFVIIAFADCMPSCWSLLNLWLIGLCFSSVCLWFPPTVWRVLTCGLGHHLEGLSHLYQSQSCADFVHIGTHQRVSICIAQSEKTLLIQSCPLLISRRFVHDNCGWMTWPNMLCSFEVCELSWFNRADLLTDPFAAFALLQEVSVGACIVQTSLLILLLPLPSHRQ